MSRRCYVATAGGFCMAVSSKPSEEQTSSRVSQDAAVKPETLIAKPGQNSGPSSIATLKKTA